VTIEGYGGFRFGMSLTDALALTRADLFNPAGLSDCFADMPTEGCFLPPSEDTSLFEMKAGIPYSLTLQFSKFDRLTDIQLGYHREGEIDRAQCLEIYERTIDWLAAEYGPIKDSQRLEGDQFENHVTPGGIPHRIGVTEDRFFVGNVERSFAGDRKLWPFATYIEVDGKPYCRVDANFSDEHLAPPNETPSPE